MNLMRFEAKKFFRSRKNIVIIIASLLIVIGNYLLMNIYDTTEIDKNYYSVQSGDLNNNISELEGIVKSQPEAKKALESTKKEAEIVNQQILAIEQQDWQAFLKGQIKYDQIQLEGVQQGTIPLDEQQLRNLYKDIAMNRYLVAHHLQPEIAGVGKAGFNYTYHLLKELMPFVGILFMLILFIDILNSEKVNKRRDFINILPFSKMRIIHAKMLTYAISAIILILSVTTLAVLSGSIFNDVGSWDYPVVHQGVSSAEVVVFNISVYIGKYLILMLLTILFFILLITLISLFIQNDFIILIITLIVILLPYVLSVYIPQVSENAVLFPVFYFKFDDLLTGEALLKSVQLTFKNAVLCLVGYSALLYVIIFVTMRFKRNI